VTKERANMPRYGNLSETVKLYAMDKAMQEEFPRKSWHDLDDVEKETVRTMARYIVLDILAGRPIYRARRAVNV